MALSSQKLSEKTADKKTVLEYEQSYFNIIYTFFKYYISVNKLILPSVRILWYIRHEITRGVNMYISWVRIYVNSWRQIREISSYFVMYNKIR